MIVKRGKRPGRATHRRRGQMRPMPRDRRLPTRGNVAPFYLKAPLSRPAYKRPTRPDVAA